MAALADTVLIAHAQPGSKTEQLAQEVVGWGKRVYTLDHAANEHLLVLGAKLLGLAGTGLEGEKGLKWLMRRA